jgi:hypothetical protein
LSNAAWRPLIVDAIDCIKFLSLASYPPVHPPMMTNVMIRRRKITWSMLTLALSQASRHRKMYLNIQHFRWEVNKESKRISSEKRMDEKDIKLM